MKHHRLAIAVALAALFAGAPAAMRTGALQHKAAAAAAKANPELVGALAKEIGGTPEQAAGAAGALK